VIARERGTNVLRLQHVHRLTHARRPARNGGDELFAFVVAAEEAVELRLVTGFADEQKQMTLLRFGLHHGNVQRLTEMRRHAEFEELAGIVAKDVHREVGLI